MLPVRGKEFIRTRNPERLRVPPQLLRWPRKVPAFSHSPHSAQPPAGLRPLGFLVGVARVSGSCGEVGVDQEASEGDVLGVVAVGPKAVPLVGVEPDGVSGFQRQHQALALQGLLPLAVVEDHRLHLQAVLHQLDRERFLWHLAHVEREVISAGKAAGEDALAHVKVAADVDEGRVEADRLVMGQPHRVHAHDALGPSHREGRPLVLLIGGLVFVLLGLCLSGLDAVLPAAVLRLVAQQIWVDEVAVEGGVVARVAVEGVARVAVETEPDGVAKLQLQHDALALHLKEEADVSSGPENQIDCLRLLPGTRTFDLISNASFKEFEIPPGCPLTFLSSPAFSS